MANYIKKAFFALILICTALPVQSQSVPIPPLKVGFIYTGPIGDHGWSYQHDQARKVVAEKFKTQIETFFLENIEEGDPAERAINQLVRQGCRLIFLTSFGFVDALHKAAPKYLNTHFEHISGIKAGKNIALFNARFYEGRYIAGQIAGKMTKTGVLGYIASFPIPEVYQGINAYMLGALSVNPHIKINIKWIKTWFDPIKEAEAARELLDEGADILSQHTDSPAALQIAEQRGMLGFGQASDMQDFAPNAQLNAIINEWTPYYTERIQLMLNKKWVSSDQWHGLAKDAIRMAPFTHLPEDVQRLAQTTQDAIRAGKTHPFTGEIYDNLGVLRIKKGETASDEQLKTMDWLVRGIAKQTP